MPNKLYKRHPRHNGKDSHRCRVTGTRKGVIRKYGINLSRKSFRERAELLGFKKYR